MAILVFEKLSGRTILKVNLVCLSITFNVKPREVFLCHKPSILPYRSMEVIANIYFHSEYLAKLNKID